MKITFLAPANSIHTVRWVNALASRGYEIALVSLHKPLEIIDKRVRVFRLYWNAPHGYFLNALSLKRILKNTNPDILHVHYASGYGTLGSLSGFHPRILSVWGQDVYNFPEQGILQKKMLIKNLASADRICSTSHVMAMQTQKFLASEKNISVTPFGVDIEKFSARSSKPSDILTVGTVKTLATKYGVDILIKAFFQARKILEKQNSKIKDQIRLLLVGGGPEEKNLRNLVESLGISHLVEFAGSVAHHQVPNFLQKLDVYVSASREDSESFGVAVIEASACEVPVIVTNVGGLPEVVENGTTGFIVAKDDVDGLAERIVGLITDQELRSRMGKAGREKVKKQYDWSANVSLMEKVYTGINV